MTRLAVEERLPTTRMVDHEDGEKYTRPHSTRGSRIQVWDGPEPNTAAVEKRLGKNRKTTLTAAGGATEARNWSQSNKQHTVKLTGENESVRQRLTESRKIVG